MFKYFPHTEKDIKDMLEVTKVDSIDALFNGLPTKLGYRYDYNLPRSMSENALRSHFKQLEKKNQPLITFRGGGIYDHYIPSAISEIVRREEFLTSYTPYQPEIAQGTLQYIFEFQSMICELTGMDVSNASMYDGATASAEAMFMATAITKRKKILISEALFDGVKEVIKTYAKYRQIEVIEVPSKEGHLALDLSHLEDIAGLIVQLPNKYGLIEDFSLIAQKIKENKGLMIINSDLQVHSLIKSPREMGADISIGHLQSLGMPMFFGGAHAGFLATTKEHIRKMPGRICGLTNDIDGKRGFVLTLQAREQHIRREKANSNICSNQSLMALWATIYLSLMGKQGLKEVNEQCYKNSHYLEEQLLKLESFKRVYQGFYIKEFVIETTLDRNKLETYLIKKGFLSGIMLEEKQLIFSVTERRTKEEIDQFVCEIARFEHDTLR
ncbi:MAG: aminomethyl-transferring glycine dehydrogenase subunit GcvPA [Paracholeplasma sp.]|nr:aminomethyl-transferring glycine dehydrogenase subunit GcvPA [Paracholeplasma sp.]MDY3196483.1 aminomethyl-transferring glycine dehydrogenase subunit GcvPA [Paracholeplasma sp.]